MSIRCTICNIELDRPWYVSNNSGNDPICNKCIVPEVFCYFGWAHMPYLKRKLLGVWRKVIKKITNG